MDAIIIDLPQELLRDAVWHLEKARKYEGCSDPFPLWREVRAAVLFSVTAIEAFMNKVAAWYVQHNANKDQVILDYLQEKERFVQDGAVRTRQRPVNLDKKVSEWTKIITGKNFDKSDSVWQSFHQVKEFRNALVHYRPECPDVYNNASIAMAKHAIISAKNIMLRYYECSEQPAPPWLNDIDVGN